MRSVLCAIFALTVTTPDTAWSRELVTVTRLDDGHVELNREDKAPVSVWLSSDTVLDDADHLVARSSREDRLRIAAPAADRSYFIVRGEGQAPVVAAERALPLEQGSNFRDVGGYVTRDGHVVRWGKVFRSGAQPMLTEADYKLVGQLGIGTVVDLRSLEERQINADTIDDREGALFVSNDYPMQDLMGPMRARKGEHIYEGMEKLLAPQYRSLYRRIMAAGGVSGSGTENGAVLYHCSAGQDRTGVATAILYDVLGVDRKTILADYHLSTGLRRPFWEMPKINPADYPDNPIALHYARTYGDKDARAEPLFTPGGESHLAQFFDYLDATYGGSEGYMRQVLGLGDQDIARLRAVMLSPA